MKIKYLKFKNWILALLAGIMGLQQGCSKFWAEEYGCPEARYIIKGTVINEQGDAIPGIGVNNTRDWENRNGEWCYEDTTDAEGHFLINRILFPAADISIPVTLYDIDSNENGSYQDTVVDVSFVGVQLSGGDVRWNKGTGEKEVSITMRRSE